MRESVLAPGKRLRPLLTVLATRDLGVDTPAALDAGCAIELLHTASLILDDLPSMGDPTLPRGSGSIHVEHGEDVAVLASIGLVAQAFGLAAVAPMASAEQRVQLVSVLAQAAGVHGLVGGRYADLRASRTPTSADVAVSNDRKSSSLFQAAIDCAGIIAVADANSRAALRTFAKELGRAFHILDDLLDAETEGGDRPTTLVSMVGPQAAHRRLSVHAEKAVAALGDLPVYPSRLSGLVQSVFAEAVEVRRHRNSAADLQVSAGAPDPAANPQFG
jgi:geranylgeranyl diphosphate synthase, type II